MKKKENNYAFIDSQNLNLSIRSQGWILDYRKFRRYLEDKYSITKAYLFLGYVPQYQDLYTSLQEDGYILIFKPTLKLPDGKVKGNVDAELVLHAMVEYPKYDKALIVTNDGDFYCLVDYLIKQDKLLKLIIPNRKAFSSLFRKLMAHIVFLDNMRDKLGFIKGKHK
ncbi:MAG: NYN domain-containing protein [Deltaproteobacteria bacterium]